MEYLVIVPILGLLMVTHELGHFLVARRAGVEVQEFGIGFPPRLFSVVRGGVRYSLNLIPLGAYVKMLGEEDPAAPRSLAAQPKRVRALVLAAGPAMNVVVAIAAFALAYATGWPDLTAMDIRIDAVEANSPAERDGLLAGDIVVAIDGQPVASLEDFRARAQRAAGERLLLTVERTGQPVTVAVTPRTSWPAGQGPLGVRLVGRALPVPHGPLESVQFGVEKFVEVVSLTVSAPVLVLRGELAPELLRPLGVPGMTRVAADAASTVVAAGVWFPILMITGAFSAGVAVANLLPLPALDGGRLLFLALEALRGRRIAPQRERQLHLVGLGVALSLMLALAVVDVLAPAAVSVDWGIR